jgi:hypothetical protein
LNPPLYGDLEHLQLAVFNVARRLRETAIASVIFIPVPYVIAACSLIPDRSVTLTVIDARAAMVFTNDVVYDSERGFGHNMWYMSQIADI